ncbi:hypothetical protein C1A50_4758 [Paenibacillus polymyxa]|nr:hypothetical protein C1A50_4758 [Paenibacillus polymyxa]
MQNRRLDSQGGLSFLFSLIVACTAWRPKEWARVHILNLEE